MTRYNGSRDRREADVGDDGAHDGPLCSSRSETRCQRRAACLPGGDMLERDDGVFERHGHAHR